MSKLDFLTAKLAQKASLPDDFFDNLMGPPVGYFFSPEDQAYIRKVILKYKGEVKFKLLNSFMKSKGFSRLSAGTNRLVYRFLDDTSFVLKVAIDRVGMQDSLLEYKNQQRLKPYVCKIFDVTQDGLLATIERVYPITSEDEFTAVQEEVFWVIVTKIIGKYVAEDIGKSYFRNWAIRPSFGVVLVDYPYIYPLAEDKLFCTNINPTNNQRCTGMIDYDGGFNHLICRKCGKRYLAVDLEDKNPTNDIIINRGGRFPMKVAVVSSDGSRYEPMMSSNVIERRSTIRKPVNRQLKVAVTTKIVDKNGNLIDQVKTDCGKEPEHNHVEFVKKPEMEVKVSEPDDEIVEEAKSEEINSDNIAKEIEELDSITETNVSADAEPIVVHANEPEEGKMITTGYLITSNPEKDKVKIEENKPARDANGRFTKKSNPDTEAYVDQLSSYGTEKYPKSKKAGGAKKAGKAGKANVNSKFIPSPGTK